MATSIMISTHHGIAAPHPATSRLGWATRQDGFSLIEIAIVLVIVGLLITLALQASTAFISVEKRKVSHARLASLDSALVNFVAMHRRLPCPANGTLASGVANAGVEQRDAATGDCTAMTDGVVPWVTLGVAESDALDGWNNRYTYRPFAPGSTLSLSRNEAMDLSHCDPAGTGAAATVTFSGQSVSTCQRNTTAVPAGTCNLAGIATCTPPLTVLTNKGLEIRDSAGNVIMNPASGSGAAYVLISHGDNGAGAYSSSGTLQGANGPPASALETQNANNTAVQAFYHDGAFIEGNSAAHFDDIVSRPSVMTVAQQAQLGPRAHLQ